MTIRIKYWLDSGANHASCRRGETTTDEAGITDDEWRAMTDEEKDEMMRGYAFEHGDWGWCAEDDDQGTKP